MGVHQIKRSFESVLHADPGASLFVIPCKSPVPNPPLHALTLVGKKSILFASCVWRRCKLSVKGMSCSSCVAHIENAVLKLVVFGVKRVSVSLLTETADIFYRPSETDPQIIAQKIESMGFDAKVIDADVVDESILKLSITGIGDPESALLIEKVVSSITGVYSSSVSFDNGTGKFVYDSATCGPRTIFNAVKVSSYILLEAVRSLVKCFITDRIWDTPS
ncbi:unnamed protein product [Soboliphyme baturini]|uniref:HMA domain-containing protein n=1 Tax=Soboliphyme baturini TaxID=241478 RepID=A0A183J9B2_9BILA|nr:unnamed protein product [Soboliphyme baturini]